MTVWQGLTVPVLNAAFLCWLSVEAGVVALQHELSCLALMTHELPVPGCRVSAQFDCVSRSG